MEGTFDNNPHTLALTSTFACPQEYEKQGKWVSGALDNGWSTVASDTEDG